MLISRKTQPRSLQIHYHNLINSIFCYFNSLENTVNLKKRKKHVVFFKSPRRYSCGLCDSLIGKSVFHYFNSSPAYHPRSIVKYSSSALATVSTTPELTLENMKDRRQSLLEITHQQENLVSESFHFYLNKTMEIEREKLSDQTLSIILYDYTQFKSRIWLGLSSSDTLDTQEDLHFEIHRDELNQIHFMTQNLLSTMNSLCALRSTLDAEQKTSSTTSVVLSISKERLRIMYFLRILSDALVIYFKTSPRKNQDLVHGILSHLNQIVKHHHGMNQTILRDYSDLWIKIMMKSPEAFVQMDILEEIVHNFLTFSSKPFMVSFKKNNYHHVLDRIYTHLIQHQIGSKSVLAPLVLYFERANQYNKSCRFFSLMISLHNDTIETCDPELLQCLDRIFSRHQQIQKNQASPQRYILKEEDQFAIQRCKAWIGHQRSTLANKIQNALRHHDVHVAFDHFKQYKPFLESRFTKMMFAKILKSVLDERKKYPALIEQIRKMMSEERDLVVSMKVYKIMMKHLMEETCQDGYFSSSVVRKIKSLVQEAIEQDEKAWLLFPTLVCCSGKEFFTDEIEKLRSMIPPDHQNIYVYTSKIRELMKENNYVGAFTELDHLLANGFKPDRYVCAVVLNAYCTAGTNEDVNRWLIKMKAEGILWDDIIYAILLKYYFKKNNLASFKAILHRMKERNIELQQSSLSRLITMMDNSPQYTALLWETLYCPSQLSLCTNSSSSSGSSTSVNCPSQSKGNNNNNPNDESSKFPHKISFDCLQQFIKVFVQHDSYLEHISQALSLMKQSIDSVHIDRKLFLYLLQVAVRHSKMTLAEHVYETMVHMKIEPCDWTFDLLMSGYQENQDENGLLSVLKRRERSTFGD